MFKLSFHYLKFLLSRNVKANNWRYLIQTQFLLYFDQYVENVYGIYVDHGNQYDSIHARTKSERQHNIYRCVIYIDCFH